MRGDTTRDSFRPGKHYRHVLQQQGRVSLDAEWNEQRSIDDHLRHRALADLLGASAGPLDGAAFAVTAAGAVVTLGAGRYYAGGVLLENEAAVALDAQPDLPPGLPAVVDAAGAPLSPPTAGRYLAELDTWTRHVTALDDPDIREIAVPVPDTTTRARTVWQVRLVRVGNQGSAVACASDVPAWNALRAPTTGRLRARSEPGEDATVPCEVPAGAGYSGPDNQHYRVEIRDGGTTGTATFVWSRENASVQARWVGQSGNRLTVAIPSRDDVVGFAPDDWIELVDDRTELGGTPGIMVQVDTAHDDVVEIRPATRLPASATVDLGAMGPNPKVRRWERAPQPTGTGWATLERGVQVSFQGARTHRSGEHWSVPARTALKDVVWPEDGGAPAFVRPAGPEHRYTRLAVLEFDGTAWSVVEDCRPLFPPLTGLVTMRYAGGDGQHAPPDPANPATLVALPERLRVAVANGSAPVAGAVVRFIVAAGSGRVDAGAGPLPVAQAVTGADGIASVAWSVDSGTAQQRVTARLLGSGGVPRDVAVTFGASLLRAAGVTLDPSDCPTLSGAATVQEALEALCAVDGTGCATIVVVPGPDWAAPIRALAPGASARICFRPGHYPLSGPLVMTGLADVSIDGAGVGSVIVAEASETALRFEGCASVTVRDVAVEARVVGAPGPGEPGQGGTITAVGCGSMSVANAQVRCAGGTRRGSACITVVGAGARTPVWVRDSTLLVGHLQTGVIVVDGRHVRVADNVVRVTPKGEALSLAVLLQDEARIRRLVGQLVDNPRLLPAGDVNPLPGGPDRLRLGPWEARFDSVVTTQDWARRVAATPPTGTDLASPDAVRSYVNRLADAAVTQPDTFPEFARRISFTTGLERDTPGDRADLSRLVISDAVRPTLRNLLVSPNIEVLAADPSPASGATVELSVGAGHVAFESPVSTNAWMAALRAMGVTTTASSKALRNSVYAAARAVLADARLRAQVPAFAGWFAGLVDRNLAAASFGVVCAGRLAEDVAVTGNRFEGVMEAVRVAVSRRASSEDPPEYAGTVRVAANEAALALPVEIERGSQGVFVGNARRLTVDGNTLSVPGVGTGQSAYANGIRVHGHLGARMAVEANVADHCDVGVRVTVLSGQQQPHLWLVRDNVAPAATPAVVAPAAVVASGNVGA
ncbi:MAG TPA: DUF6519 domain-containing protein [Acidimicrobiales bacterium]|nr:DUF6519 domain-containing protein [Acidimicrobiales bacterium]